MKIPGEAVQDCGKTGYKARQDRRLSNERIREAPKVGEIEKKFKRGGGTGK